MTLCDTFKRLSIDTWDKIQESRKVDFQLKEETFTDMNMLALKARHGGQIVTRVFTKRKEGINGADWEWWLKGKTNKWIGLRIQAKIINIKTDEFEHLHYQNPKTNAFQCDNLINNALTGPSPRIPLYCFYLQTDNITHLTKWDCGTYPSLKDLYGCSLTSAFTVKKLRASAKKKLTDIESYLKPWHCLVCCVNYGKSDLTENIQAYVKNNFEITNNLTGDSGVPLPDSFLTENPPGYVLAISENSSNQDITPPDADIDGVIIYKEVG